MNASTDNLEIDAVTDETQNAVETALELWPPLKQEDRKELFNKLSREDKDELFIRLNAKDQVYLLEKAQASEKRIWARLLAPDDATDFIQELEEADRPAFLELLDFRVRTEVKALLAYREDQAGGLMSPRFARVRPEMRVEEAIRYLRAQTQAELETIYYAYVLDNNQKLLGVVSLRQLFGANQEKTISEVMITHPDIITISESEDQEEIMRLFSQWEFIAIPVVNSEGQMKGIVTVDDMVEVAQEEATEDIQKFGGVEALDAPYFEISFLHMIRKRAVWLLILFVGEMFTATAMGYFETEISKALVLALFIPLIISSGGNTGSQASTLIIRAMALGEIRLQDWWRVFGRELASGLTLGLILGVFGFLRIVLWPSSASLYGEHYFLIGVVVSLSLLGIVMWGTLTGSMLPFLLRRLRLDPATASAPFVATLVDVTGLVIYFSVAHFILKGVLL